MAHLHHVERVGALHRLGTVLNNCLGDEVRAIGCDMSDIRAPLRAQGVEEALHRGRVPSWRRPHQPAGAVIDHDQQIQVPSAALTRVIVEGFDEDFLGDFEGASERLL